MNDVRTAAECVAAIASLIESQIHLLGISSFNDLQKH